MTSKHAYFLMLATIGLSALGIIGALYIGNKMLVARSSELTELKAVNEILDDQEVSLVKAKQDIKKYKNLEELTQTIVPRDKDQARAVREIVALAQESGVPIKSIVFPSSNLGSKAKETAKAPDSTEEKKPDPISQAKPLKDIKGVYSLEATITPSSEVNYYQFIDFLSKLEKNRRTAQVTSIKIDPKSSSRNNPQITFSLTINIFLKP